MKELTLYLLENLVLDFQGEVSVEAVRNFLREDDSTEARRLLKKIIEEDGIDDLLITVADCLKDNIASGIHQASMRDALNLYSES